MKLLLAILPVLVVFSVLPHAISEDPARLYDSASSEPPITGNAHPTQQAPKMGGFSAEGQVSIGNGIYGLKRVIIDSADDEKVRLLEQSGCTMRRAFGVSASFTCPSSVQAGRESRIFRIADDTSNAQINADDVWPMGITGKGVKVAILDTGVDLLHIELNDSYLGGYDFVDNDTIPEDSNGHGTHVAGIITSNGIYKINGVSSRGVAPDSGFYMLKVCNPGGMCDEDDIMAAMEYAATSLDAKVISISLGGENYNGACDSDPLAAKVNWLVDKGILVVIAAGNSGADAVSTPACASKAVAVGGVNSLDVKASWSNYGKELDIVAPGVGILSTYSCTAAGDCGHYWYAYLSGTSMATPHVSGTAALILEKYPNYTVSEIKNALYSSAKKLSGTFSGNGRVDALAAVSNTATLPPSLAVYNVSVKTDRNSATISWKTTLESRDTLRWGTTKSTTSATSLFSYSTQKSVRLFNLQQGKTYYFKIQARDRKGNIVVDDNGGVLYNFTIEKPALVPLSISNVSVVSNGNSAVVKWRTSVQSSGALYWGTDTGFLRRTYVFGYSTEKSVTLNSLANGRTYYFRIREIDRSGNVAVDDNGGKFYSFVA